MKQKAATLCIILMIMVIIITGCSQDGCSCDSGNECECVTDTTLTQGAAATGHYECDGGSSDCGTGCDSCSSGEGDKDGDSCTPT